MNQAIYITCALMMIGLLSRSVNATRLAKDEAMYNSQGIVTATTVAQSLMQEILTKRFDENAAANIKDSTQFTPVNNLGCEAGESPTNPTTLDDIDDYKSYTPSVATDLGQFKVQCSIYYVSSTAPDSKSTIPTFMKRIDVKVKNGYVPNTADSSLTLSRIVSYR
jgi:hypothetical protein